MAILWAIAFLAYFTKSVLELPDRLDFNRRLQQNLPNLRRRQRMTASLEECLPGPDQNQEVGDSGSLSGPSLPSRTGNLGRRLMRLISSREGEEGQELRSLTLANPVAEVLKVRCLVWNVLR